MFLSFKNILPEKGSLFYEENFLSEDQSQIYFNKILDSANWKQEKILIFGREVMQPRLVAWHADEGVNYGYSGKRLIASPWTRELAELKSIIEAATGSKFNSALLNLYRDGQDSMGWHRDNEPELGEQPVIASLSLGESRRFLLRRKIDKGAKLEFNLGNGSLLVMGDQCQQHWEHSVPKTAKFKLPRINITFRRVIKV